MPRQCLYQGQRQRHRSTTKQQQQQCTTTGTATAITSCAVQSVIQNVMECSIANVCANRGIFPKTFFEYRTVHDGTVVPRFDKEYLDRNVDDNVGVAVVESGLGDDVSGDTSESDYSNYGNNHTRKARKHNNHNSKRMKKTNTENNLLKEEARLLLQWIQNGIGQSIQEGIVSRVTLGICLTNTRHAAGLHAYPLDMTPTPSIVETNTMNTSCRYDTLSATTTGMTKTTTQPISAISSTMTTSTSSTSPPQSKSCSATRNQMTSGDQLVESYSVNCDRPQACIMILSSPPYFH